MTPEDGRPRPAARVRLLGGLVLLLLLLSLSALIRASDLDPTVSGWFHRPGEEPDWWGKDRPVLDLVYEVGVWPANLLGIAGLLGWILSRFRPRLRRARRTFVYLFLVWTIGPGILVNMVGKDHAGRPRPRETIRFGGESEYLPVGEPGIPGKGKSFPSGHAAMGAYLAGLALLSRRRALLWTGIGLGAWGLLGFQRIAVGAHFLSDVLWSGGIVGATALAVDAALPRDPAGERRLVRPGALIGIAAAAAVLAFLLTPYHALFEKRFGPPRSGAAWIVERDLPGVAAAPPPDRIPATGGSLLLRLEVRGYGIFSNEAAPVWRERDTPEGTILSVGLERSGFFTRLAAALSARVLPPGESRALRDPAGERLSASVLEAQVELADPLDRVALLPVDGAVPPLVGSVLPEEADEREEAGEREEFLLETDRRPVERVLCEVEVGVEPVVAELHRPSGR